MVTGEGPELALRYRTDGYVVVRALVAPETVTSALARLNQLRAERPEGAGILALPLARDGTAADPWLTDLVRDERLVGLASLLLDHPAVCFGCAYMVKPAGTGLPALWHQDGHPWSEGLGITEAVTLWIALDDVGPDNGAMEVVAGSHILPAHPIVAVEGQDGGFFGGGMDAGLAAELVDPSAVRRLELSAGDGSAHHPCVVHGSGPNWSGRDRRALVVRYRPA